MAPTREPSLGVAIKLASLAVHAEELLAPGGHPADRQARRRRIERLQLRIQSLLTDPEVAAYLAELENAGLLPVKRTHPGR
jgi:hypothetical protein